MVGVNHGKIMGRTQKQIQLRCVAHLRIQHAQSRLTPRDGTRVEDEKKVDLPTESGKTRSEEVQGRSKRCKMDQNEHHILLLKVSVLSFPLDQC